MAPKWLVLVILVVVGIPHSARAQTRPATAATPPLNGSCGAYPANIDYDFNIFKNGNIIDKDAYPYFWMDNIRRTVWAVCNDLDKPAEIKFVKLSCQGGALTECPVDWGSKDSLDQCAGQVKSANGNNVTIPSHAWGLIDGSPNPNRPECDDPQNTLRDAYDFKVSVKPEGEAEQTIDPEIQIDRDTTKRGMYKLVFGGLVSLFIGVLVGRWLGMRQART